jgi:hypothetical protein
MIDLKPADPIEGILISQLVVAHQASLKMYRRAWAQPLEYFEVQIKYLALADKAARTVATLTERLDHHRNRGQQKIVVQHTTTVNADQALITENIVTGKASCQETATRSFPWCERRACNCRSFRLQVRRREHHASGRPSSP